MSHGSRDGGGAIDARARILVVDDDAEMRALPPRHALPGLACQPRGAVMTQAGGFRLGSGCGEWVIWTPQTHRRPGSRGEACARNSAERPLSCQARRHLA